MKESALLILCAGLILGCKPKTDLECLLPTYDLPKGKLQPSEAHLLASMCTENWAKSWAVRSRESAGDIADAIRAQCQNVYFMEAEARWPSPAWPIGTAMDQLPSIVSEWHDEAVRQVVRTRASGCRKLESLPKQAWITSSDPSDRKSAESKTPSE